MTPETSLEIALPAVPLTMEGASLLHQMMRFRRPAWRTLAAGARTEILEEAIGVLAPMERAAEGRPASDPRTPTVPVVRQSALYSLLGHKGDLLFLHFRRSF